METEKDKEVKEVIEYLQERYGTEQVSEELISDYVNNKKIDYAFYKFQVALENFAMHIKTQ